MNINDIDDLYFMPVAEEIIQHLSSLLDVNTIFIACNDLKTNKVLRAINKAEILVQEGTMPFEDTYCSLVIKNKTRPTVVENTKMDFYTRDMTFTKLKGGSYFVGYPIILRNGDLFGTLCALDRDRNMTEKELELIVSISKFLGYLIDLERDIIFDTLTGLNTREYIKMYFDYLKIDSNKCVSVFLININRFKSFNYSKKFGDYLLKIVGERIKFFAGKDGIAARLYGDQFLLVNFEVDSNELKRQLAVSIIESISRPIEGKFQKVFLTARVGISFYDLGEWKSIDTLIQQAEFAMDEIKATQNYIYCTKDIIQKKERTILIETNLLQELKENQFEMYYQPQFIIDTGEIAGFEALIRWKSEKFGFISPAEFIPIAEKTGLIIPLGDWIFKNVFNQMSEWNKKCGSNYTVAINLSPPQIEENRASFERIDELANRYGILTSQLHFEITETSIFDSDNKMVSLLKSIREKGIKIALDDFGTGYSSVMHLRNLPIDIIKIDQVFVKELMINENDKKIIKAIIDLAEALGLKVVAEGIENEEILHLLHSLGCDIAQGYLLGKPMEASRAEKLLYENRLEIL